MNEQHKKMSRRVFDIINGDADVAELDELVSPDLVDHDDGAGASRDGVDVLRKTISSYRHAFPDLVIRIEDQIAEEDRVLTRWVARGTLTGDFMGIPATGRFAEFGGVGIDRFENGKIVECWGYLAETSMYRQLGYQLVPEQPADR
ncbi:ester cyclase [Streptomyces sp. NPDC004838]